MVDATKFYLSATKQGLTCDMKVAPTRYFSKCEGELETKFVSFQHGNAGATALLQAKGILDKVPFDKELYDVMAEIRSFPNFNIYA